MTCDFCGEEWMGGISNANRRIVDSRHHAVYRYSTVCSICYAPFQQAIADYLRENYPHLREKEREAVSS